MTAAPQPPARRPAPYLPRPASPAPRNGAFAATWWGNAWVESMEDTALDPARLQRGRAYADGGHVDAITVTPGRVMAYVHGSRPRPYRTEIRLRTLGRHGVGGPPRHRGGPARPHRGPPGQGDAARAGRHAADLLPGGADLTPDCSCPDDGYPCKHAAALCYQTARLLDEDPFVLFLMRGRGEQEVLADLTRRNAARSAAERSTTAPPMPTVAARTALMPRTLPPCPRRSRFPTCPDGPRSTRSHRHRAPRTRSRSTSWPLKRRPVPTRSSPRGSTRSPPSPPGRTPYAWPPPTRDPG